MSDNFKYKTNMASFVDYEYNHNKQNMNEFDYSKSYLDDDLKNFLKDTYCNYVLNKSDINEELIFNEQNLREELELYNKDKDELYNKDEYDKDNKDIPYSSMDTIKKLIMNNSSDEDVYGYLELHNNNCYFLDFLDSFFFFPRECDLIKKLYLEIEIDSSEYEELTFDEKMKILDIGYNISVIIKSTEKKEKREIILSGTILSSLFIDYCNNKSIVHKDNKLEILLVDFTTMSNHFNPLKNYGLPIISAKDTELIMTLYNENSNFYDHKIFNPKIKYLGSILDSPYRADIIRNQFYYYMLQSYKICPNAPLNISEHTKCLLIYYRPKIPDTNYLDYVTNYPILIGINLCGQYYDASELLSFELLGITVYILPLVRDFRSWSSIKKCMSNNFNIHNDLSWIDMFTLKYIKVFFHNDDDKYSFICISLSSNILNIKDGKMEMSYK